MRDNVENFARSDASWDQQDNWDYDNIRRHNSTRVISVPRGDSSVIEPRECCSTLHFEKFGIGYFYIILVLTCWVVQSELSQSLQTTSHYNKPYFMTYFNHSWCGIMLPIMGVYYRLKRRRNVKVSNSDLESILIPSAQPQNVTVERFSQYWTLVGYKPYLTFVALFTCVYSAADYCWYIALPHVSVAVGTVLFNSSCIFTYIRFHYEFFKKIFFV